MAGYSKTPLVKKLGIKEGFRVYIVHPPDNYGSLLGSMPDGVAEKERLEDGLNFVHLFTASRAELVTFLPAAKEAVRPDGMIWRSWPKKAAKVATDVTEDVIREVCLPLDLVDVKVCAVDEIWSGLKLVIRKEKR